MRRVVQSILVEAVKMRLVVDNIGKVKHADIEIDGITVVAGENNTGKSTLGKTLWCVFNSFHNLETRIHEERKRRIERELGRVLGIRNQLWCQGDWMGMVVEDTGQSLIYRCNDCFNSSNFDSLVFSLELLDGYGQSLGSPSPVIEETKSCLTLLNDYTDINEKKVFRATRIMTHSVCLTEVFSGLDHIFSKN